MGANYLLRFDDICPTMNWEVWREIEDVLVHADIRPILGVVPKNQDRELWFDEPRADFWPRVRSWQARGGTIGLHGFEHRYVTRESGLVGLNRRSEFAGVPAAEQEVKLRHAVDIFRSEQVRPEVWIAPAHSFDETTITILKGLDIGVISDGFYLSPHRDKNGMLWIPQQIWSFRARPFGLWTICYHHNSWTSADLADFKRGLSRYRPHITSFGEVMRSAAMRSRTWRDPLVARGMLTTIRVKSRLRRLATSLLRRRSAGLSSAQQVPGAAQSTPQPGQAP